MKQQFQIPDKRGIKPEHQDKLYNLGRLKTSWQRGTEEHVNGIQEISFEDGLTWGSIGKIFGYLFGEVDDMYKEELYIRMLEQYKRIHYEKSGRR